MVSPEALKSVLDWYEKNLIKREKPSAQKRAEGSFISGI